VRPGAPAVWAGARQLVLRLGGCNKDGAARGLAAARRPSRLRGVARGRRADETAGCRRVGPAHRSLHAAHGHQAPWSAHLAGRSIAQGAAQPPARDHGRGRRKTSG
jgi:hypothetical protein